MKPKTMKRQRIKLRSHKMDKLGKGYYPIYKTFDESGNPLTYIVKTPVHEFEFNTLEEARVMAIRI